MKKSILIVAIGLAAGVCSMAGPVNITIADGNNGNGATLPWMGQPGAGAGHEDNETEPGTYTGDIWDLEAFVYNPGSSTLSLIGTYDFMNGQDFNNRHYGSGAIFIKGSGSSSWNYAYVLDFTSETYNLYDSFSTLTPSDIAASAPWTVDIAQAHHQLGTGSFTYSTDINDPFGLGLLRANGAGHNEIDLGLGLLPGSVLGDFDSHFTMSCGNDLVVGHYTAPDGGTTATFLSTTLAALALLRRKLRFV